MQRERDQLTGGGFPTVSTLAFPVMAAIVEIAVAWRDHCRARVLFSHEAALAVPFVTSMGQVAARRNLDGHALVANDTEASIAFPSQSNPRVDTVGIGWNSVQHA